MFSSEVKIISVGSNKEGCHRELISSTSDYIKSQTPVQDQKYCGSNKFNHKYNNNKHIGNSKYNGNNKYVKKANKYQISNCEKVYLNNNNNTTSKNLNLPNNKTTLNINNNINNNNNNNKNNSKIIDNNNSIVNKLELSPPRTKSHSGKFECSIHSKSPSKDSMVMNNTPKTTQALTVTTSAPVSPASYSLDFLHSVGVQMTAGTNRSYTPSASPSRHPNLINAAGTHQCGFVVTTSEDSSTAVVANSSNNTACSSTLNGHAKPATTATYKEYNFSSPMNSSNSQNPNNGMSMPPTGSFSYRNTYGYPVHNYPNHNGARNYNSHFQYHSVSGHNFNGYNRGQIQKKSWTGINQVSFKKCCNMSGNKYGSVSSSNLNSPQTIPRTRNQQNLRNVTYIHTHTGRIIGNSRSPTPSPKSESPSLYKAQQMQECNAIVQGNSMDQGSLIATSAPSIDMSNTNGAMNGYDSDSSHSSYRHNEFAYRSKSLAVSPNFQLTEIQPLISFSTFSEEDLKNHVNYYGSHQNLTFWNSGMTTNYSPHSLYSTSGSGSSEAGSQYLSEGNFPQKRSQSQNRTYRGRRNVYPNFRPHSFHENMFTPPDRFLARAHLIEIKECPDSLLNGTKWDHLSQSIWEKFMMSQQREETYRRKMYLWRYLYVTIKKAHPRYGLYLVGSTISGFGADTSDVDMCLVSRVSGITDPRMESVFNLNQLKEYLTTTGVFEQFNLIEAKVPILRFRDSMHNLEVDLNFNNCVGIRNTHLLHCYSQLDWRLRPMVLVTKLWAQYHNINNAKNMTISSYSLVLMVIHFLQFAIEPAVLPCLHEMYPEKFHILLKPNDFGFVDMNEEIDPYPSQNTQSLGELFLQFLEYYSNFDYTQYAISIRTGSLLPIEVCRQAKTAKNDNRQWKELCIEEPFDLTNTARSVYDCETFERIKAIFIASWKILQETMDLNAIFSPIVSATISQVPLSLTPTIS